MSGSEEISYPVVFKKNPNRLSRINTNQAGPFDNYDGLVSGGVYSWLSQQALDSKGSAKKQACVKEIIQKRKADLKTLQSALRATYTPVSDKLDEYRKRLVGPVHQENASPKPQRNFFASPTGKRIKQRFKGPLVPGLMPKERYYVEKDPVLQPATRHQQAEFYLEPIDSALAVEDKKGRDLIKGLQKRHRQLAYFPIQKHGTAASERPSPATPDVQPAIGETTRRLLLNPRDLQVIVSNTIKSLKTRPDFSSIDLEPQTINYKLLAKSLERPNCKLKLQDRNLELFQLAKNPVCRLHQIAAQPSEPEPHTTEAKSGKDLARPPKLNVHTLPYLYMSPSV